VVRVATAAFALVLLSAAPASPRTETAPVHYYRVTAGSMTIETREELGYERLRWAVAPHPRGTRPARGFPTADGSGGPRSFALRYPVRGVYTYDYKQEDLSSCKEAFLLTRASRGAAVARTVGARVRISWGLDPRRRAGYVPDACRPQKNNALAYFVENQSSLTVNVASSALRKTTFTVSARGTQTGPRGTVTWQISFDVRRLGVR
jgi:hypothetical protein